MSTGPPRATCERGMPSQPRAVPLRRIRHRSIAATSGRTTVPCNSSARARRRQRSLPQSRHHGTLEEAARSPSPESDVENLLPRKIVPTNVKSGSVLATWLTRAGREHCRSSWRSSFRRHRGRPIGGRREAEATVPIVTRVEQPSIATPARAGHGGDGGSVVCSSPSPARATVQVRMTGCSPAAVGNCVCAT